MLPLEVVSRNRVACVRCKLRGPVGDGPCACTVDGIDIIDHADAAYCPLASPRFGTGAKPAGWDELPKAEHRSAAAVIDDRLSRYHAAWHRLHTFCLTAPTPCALVNFLSDWERTIPCGECRAEYRAFVERVHADPVDPFAWSVRLHNHVNAKLNKPQWTVERARAAWSR